MRSYLAILILIVLGTSVLPASLTATTREWLGSVDQAMDQAREKDQQILVDLYADWCGWCKRLEQDVFSTPEFQEFAKDFILLRVDTEDGGEGTRLQEQYDAYSLPTTLVLDADRIMIADVKGYAPAPQYIATIRQEIASFDELLRGYEQFKTSEDLRVLSILADEFHKRNDGERASSLYERMLDTGQIPPEKAVRFRYQMTDALRLAGQFDQAVQELQLARPEAVRLEDSALVQRFDLLAAQVSLDRGDCDEAQQALEEFVETYTGSELVRVARRTLQNIQSQGQRCT